MSARTLINSILLALLAGCQAAPPAGRSALRLFVSAEPKTGIRPAAKHVSVSDSTDAAGYSTASAGGDYDTVDYSALSDVVIWLEPLDQSATSAASPDVNVAVNTTKPADGVAAAVCAGQKITFTNRGDKPAEIYSGSDGNEFNLGSLAPGASGSYTVKGSGLIEVFSSKFPDPIANVYVAPTPWSRLTRTGKTLVFNDLPAGQYRIKSWHPRLPGQQTTANLQADHITTASIKVSVNGLPPVALP